MSNEPLLSVVVPVYNEAAGVEDFHHKLLMPSIAKSTNDSFEIIYVNDGSEDGTLAKLSAIATANDHVKIVSLSRNFGKEVATSAGITYASGNATIIIDSDGQHPPAHIPEFIAKWRAGAQVVTGIRQKNEREGTIKKWGSKIFYSVFNSMNDVRIVPRSTDFRLIDHVVREEFVKLPEHNRITRGLIDWLGFTRDYVYFDAPPRLAGSATYGPQKLIGLAINSFVSLSLKPLYILAWVGLGITLVSFALGVFMFVEQFILPDPLHLKFTGAALLGIFISFLIGLVITSQGVLAAYLSHIHTHTQGRPLYVVDHTASMGIE